MFNKKILITDDAEYMRKMLRGILMPEKFAIIEACNGQEAIDQYLAHKPDLVFMDITMPVMDGIIAVKSIKEKDPNAKIVMCSALGQKDTVLEAIRAGAAGFVVKPFKPDGVIEAVKKSLN